MSQLSVYPLDERPKVVGLPCGKNPRHFSQILGYHGEPIIGDRYEMAALGKELLRFHAGAETRGDMVHFSCQVGIGVVFS